ncbi:MAG: acetyltransferase, family [Ramlibacter sp.]|jgi:ribosomal protein S18 acetylase RimI-like enzyme|nr:acetyltransferase, family [Ramlibacter sp.]
MNIRPATLDDAGAIATVHVDAWRRAYAGVLPQATLDGLSVDARSRMWSQAIAGTRGRVLVAEQEGQLLGFAAFGHCRDEGSAPTDHELWAIYVAPSRWRAGAGRALWDGARRAMVEGGAATISVWVLAENAPARGFYASLGFRLAAEAGERAISVAGLAVQEIRFVLRIAPGASSAH